MTTNQILFGLGLVLVLAVGSQLLARRLRVPALVVLLPAGVLAGAATDDVHPDNLLGALYQPFVSLAVGVILFEAGLRLSFGEVASGIRNAVVRLVVVGVAVTSLCVAAAVSLLFDGMDSGVPWLIGAILVVSGPTVVLPLLAFIRPTREIRSLLKWEGVLVDPVGALLGVLVFEAISSGQGWQTGEMLIGLSVGALVGVVGVVVLRLLLGEVQSTAPRMAVPVALAVVVAAVVAADLVREDAGLAAATLMGIALGNQRFVAKRRAGITLTLEFEETLVQLLIGVLFVLVAASVSFDDVRSVMPQALVLVAIMVVFIRPAAVFLATLRTRFSWRQRAFFAWMAPRGIVAGATASAFGPELQQQGIAGAGKVLPIVFVAIFGTVVLYGLTGPLVARWLGVAGGARQLVLVVGGHPWTRELAAALKDAGVAVRMWVGPTSYRTAARDAGLEAARGRIMVDALSRENELEEVTDALLLTPSDDFNMVAGVELRDDLGDGHVFRVAPDPEAPDLVPPLRDAGILGDRSLTFDEFDTRFNAGARIVSRGVDDPGGGPAETPLFVVRSNGRVKVAADGRPPEPRSGDTVILFAPARPR